MRVKNYWLTAIVLLLFGAGAIIAACNGDDDDDNDDASDDDASPVDDDDATPDDDDTTPDTDDDSADDDDVTPGEFSCNGDVCSDPASGLMWQNGDACDLNWAGAKSHCEQLSWGGFDDWRLPTVSELRSLIRGCDNTATGGDCGVTDECLAYMMCWNPPCNGCPFFSGPGPAGRYCPAELAGDGWIHWTTQQVTENSDTAWRIHFYNGLVSYNDTTYLYCARCVR